MSPLIFYLCRVFAQPATREKKPMRYIDPHRQYAFSQSAGTTL
jgi:hypothetical protein